MPRRYSAVTQVITALSLLTAKPVPAKPTPCRGEASILRAVPKKTIEDFNLECSTFYSLGQGRTWPVDQLSTF